MITSEPTPGSEAPQDRGEAGGGTYQEPLLDPTRELRHCRKRATEKRPGSFPSNWFRTLLSPGKCCLATLPTVFNNYAGMQGLRHLTIRPSRAAFRMVGSIMKRTEVVLPRKVGRSVVHLVGGEVPRLLGRQSTR
jgi:hypothetical protein